MIGWCDGVIEWYVMVSRIRGGGCVLFTHLDISSYSLFNLPFFLLPFLLYSPPPPSIPSPTPVIPHLLSLFIPFSHLMIQPFNPPPANPQISSHMSAFPSVINRFFFQLEHARCCSLRHPVTDWNRGFRNAGKWSVRGRR